MGADSLVLLDAINTIKDRYGVAIPVRALFEELTLEAVIAFVVEHAQTETAWCWSVHTHRQPAVAAQRGDASAGQQVGRRRHVQALIARQLELCVASAPAAERYAAPCPADCSHNNKMVVTPPGASCGLTAPAKASAQQLVLKETKKFLWAASDRHLAQLTPTVRRQNGRFET